MKKKIDEKRKKKKKKKDAEPEMGYYPLSISWACRWGAQEGRAGAGRRRALGGTGAEHWGARREH